MKIGYKYIKRFFDFTFALIILFVSIPLMLIVMVSLFIILRSSPFYNPIRIGKDNQPFKVFKFKTMFDGKEGIKHDETYIIPMGNFIRRFHLDELPQLINIVLGQMSFIGPRNEHIDYYNQMIESFPEYRIRYCVRPGLLGIAQIKQGHTDTIKEGKQKFRFDKLYINNQSFCLDLKIFFMALPELFNPKVSR